MAVLLWCCSDHRGIRRSDSAGPLWCLGPTLDRDQEALSHGKGREVNYRQTRVDLANLLLTKISNSLNLFLFGGGGGAYDCISGI